MKLRAGEGPTPLADGDGEARELWVTNVDVCGVGAHPTVLQAVGVVAGMVGKASPALSTTRSKPDARPALLHAEAPPGSQQGQSLPLR